MRIEPNTTRLEFLPRTALSPAVISGLLEKTGAKVAVRDDTVSRRFLDTFDWRLFRAGVSLEIARTGSTSQLLLYEPGVALPTAQVIAKTPRFVWDLPAGRVRSVLEPLIEMRALLTAVQLRTQRADFRLLNSDQKTVFRLLLDTSKLSRAKALPPRLTVNPVLGYQKWADRALKQLRREVELQAAGQSVFIEALERAGLDPIRLYPSASYDISADDRADESCKHALAHYADVLEVNLPGVIDDIDTECLHDFRVAVRRTRSVLKQSRTVFPSRIVSRFRNEFGWLGRATSPMRDLDVYLLDFDDYVGVLSEPYKSDLEQLRSFLLQTRVAELAKLRTALRSRRLLRLLEDWRRFLDQPVPKRTVLAGATQRTAVVANNRIWKSYKKVVRQGRQIGKHTPEEKLHDLRKTCKEFRYLIELYRQIYPSKSIRKVINALKRLQDNLGRVQDFTVQSATLTHFGDELAEQSTDANATQRAIKKLVKKLQRHQKEARDEFSARFAEFDATENRAAIRALFKPDQQAQS